MQPSDAPETPPRPPRAERRPSDAGAETRALFDRAPTPSWVCDAETLRVLFANEAAAALLGQGPREAEGRPIGDVLGAGVAVTARLHAWAPGAECVAVARDGSRRELSLRVAPVNVGDVPALLVQATDVTARNAAARELRASEERLRSLFEYSGAGIRAQDLSGRCLGTNARLAELTGYSEAELHARPVETMLADDGAARLADELDRAAAGTRVSGEFTLVRADGARVPVLVAGVPMLAEGAVVGVYVALQDISRRARAEEELRFQTSLLEAQNAVSIDGIAVIGINGAGFRSYNRRFREMWSLPEEAEQWPRERCLRHMRDQVEDPEGFQKRLAQLYADPEERAWDEIRLVDGRVFDRYSAPVRSAEGRYFGRAWFFRDVTVQKRTEEELRQQALIFQTISDGVLLMDLDGRIVDWNPAAARMFGYEKQEVLGRSPAMLHEPRVRGTLEPRIHAAVTRDGRWAGEIPFMRKDGSTGVADSVVVVQRDSHGVPVGRVGVHRDVTERRRAQEALRESEERFRQLAESIRDVFYLHDVASRRLLYVSPAFETTWGRSRETLYADTTSWRQALHPDDRERVRAAREAQPLGPTELEYRIVRPDGEVRWIRDRNFPIRDERGRIYRHGGIAEDITTRKRLEEQLLQAQKMEAVGRLAGGLAHDFNNILTAIKCYTQFMKRDAAPDDPQRENIEGIDESADRAVALTRQLLSFSRRQVVQPRVVDVGPVLQGIGGMLRRLVGHDVQLTLALDAELGAVVVDPGQLEQVVMNLVVNARDATPAGGRIIVEAGNVTRPSAQGAPGTTDAADERPRPFVRLAVRDTGSGMSPETRARLFEPFFTTKANGTGLGLSTVEAIVHQSGGLVEVESAPGEGTVVSVYLPRVTAEEADAAPEAQGEAAAGGTETVLLVEDDDDIRQLVHRVLDGLGYDVLVAPNGRAALQVAGWVEHPIALVLTDVIMPEMNGRELAERLAADRPGIKILYMSAYTHDELGERGVLGPSIAFLQKPFTPEALARRIRAVLDA